MGKPRNEAEPASQLSAPSVIPCGCNRERSLHFHVIGEKAKLFCDTWKFYQYYVSVPISTWLPKEALIWVHIFYGFFSNQELRGLLLKCLLAFGSENSCLIAPPLPQEWQMALNAQLLTVLQCTHCWVLTTGISVFLQLCLSWPRAARDKGNLCIITAFEFIICISALLSSYSSSDWPYNVVHFTERQSMFYLVSSLKHLS